MSDEGYQSVSWMEWAPTIGQLDERADRSWVREKMVGWVANPHEGAVQRMEVGEGEGEGVCVCVATPPPRPIGPSRPAGAWRLRRWTWGCSRSSGWATVAASSAGSSSSPRPLSPSATARPSCPSPPQSCCWTCR